MLTIKNMNLILFFYIIPVCPAPTNFCWIRVNEIFYLVI